MLACLGVSMAKDPDPARALALDGDTAGLDRSVAPLLHSCWSRWSDSRLGWRARIVWRRGAWRDRLRKAIAALAVLCNILSSCVYYRAMKAAYRGGVSTSYRGLRGCWRTGQAVAGSCWLARDQSYGRTYECQKRQRVHNAEEEMESMIEGRCGLEKRFDRWKYGRLLLSYLY